MSTTRSTRVLLFAAMATAFTAIVALPAGAASAAPSSPEPSASGDFVTTAGTSFLTAATIKADEPVKVSASTGDYMYWAFTAKAGQTAGIAATISLPKPGSRHAAATWTVEVFDGLRRRQACTSGAQAPVAAVTDTSVTLGCALREVRSWAEPWSGDPLPGTYYVRISATSIPDEDIGLALGVDMQVNITDSGDPAPEGGNLAAPLDPAVKPGTVLTSVTESAAPKLTSGWLPSASSRWTWTTVGGVLAAIASVAGFALTRRPLRRRLG